MKQFIEYADILVAVPCYLGYLYMADKFCKKNLGASKNVIVNNCVGFGSSPFYGTQKVVVYGYQM